MRYLKLALENFWNGFWWGIGLATFLTVFVTVYSWSKHHG